jgi:1-acyl-sn-glycerol-3-phosphate acyltransferase
MPADSQVSPWLFAVLRPIHRVFMAVYFRVEIRHPERIPASGPVILVPTHRSRWDAFGLFRSTRRRLHFLASHDEFVGAQGWFMRRLGAFPVDTERPSPSVMRHCRELLAAGEALVIFPEATIYYYPPHQVHPLKPGAAWLALDAQRKDPATPLSVVPVRLVYSDRYLNFRSRIEVDVREPIPLAPFLEKPPKEAMHLLTADMQRALGDVVNESLAEQIPPRPRAAAR